MKPDYIYQKLAEAGREWAEAESIAQKDEEMRKPILAELKLLSDKTSDAAKEMEALASETYKEHIEKMTNSRREANLKKVEYRAREVWVEAWRTEQATIRAETKVY